MVTKFVARVRGFFRRTDGASLVEYGLLIALIAAACIVAIAVIPGGLNKVFNYVGTKLNSAA